MGNGGIDRVYAEGHDDWTPRGVLGLASDVRGRSWFARDGQRAIGIRSSEKVLGRGS
jgi:hypothetical protein